MQVGASGFGVPGDDQLNEARYVAYSDKRSSLYSPFHINVQDRIPHSQMGGKLRIILGVIRLHAAREMLRMSPPLPSSFLVFSLYDDLPKGDFVLEQLASNLKQTSTITRLSASYVFKSLSKSRLVPLSAEMAKDSDTDSNSREQPLASLENTIDQVKDETKEVTAANVAIDGMKDEGITDSLVVLVVRSFP